MTQLQYIYIALIIYFLVANFIFLLLLVFSFFQVRRVIRSSPMISSLKRHAIRVSPPISLIAPAHNEERSIVESVQSFLRLDYSQFEVIIVNDGSTDRTLQKLIDKFDFRPIRLFRDTRVDSAEVKSILGSGLYPNLLLIDKAAGGKADAINAGIAYARHDLFCAVDSDSILEGDALSRVVLPFMEDPERTVASGGTVRPVNGSEVRAGRVVRPGLPKSLLARLQIVEYLRAFLFGRVGWNVLHATMIISGAFGLFKKEEVIQAGGYTRGSLGEDMELVVRLRDWARKNHRDIKIAFVPDPICWTEVPTTLSQLWRQRDRWQRGLAESLIKHRHMTFNPRFKLAGLIAFPYLYVVELFGPLIEFLAYTLTFVGVTLGWIPIEFVFLFLTVDILYNVLMSFGAVLIDESAFHKYPRLKDLLRLMIAAFGEQFGYRQINMLFRSLGLIKFFIGYKSWGEMKREGFGA